MKPGCRKAESEKSEKRKQQLGTPRPESAGTSGSPRISTPHSALRTPHCPRGFPLSRFPAFRFSAFSAQAFTLIELLIVISIMAILAAMIIPISGAVSRNRIKAKARAELEQVATAIELYKAKLGTYPPDNPRNPGTNQLYFELLGTTLSNNVYTTLDGSAYVRSGDLGTVFGGNPPAVGGFVNSSRGTGGDEARSASSFLKGLKPAQFATIYNSGGDLVKILVSSAPAQVNVINPIYYNSSNPTNNPNSYDLWVDIPISGKTNRISNWSQQITILP